MKSDIEDEKLVIIKSESELISDPHDQDNKNRNKILLAIEKYFKIYERKSKWSTEIRGGCITFVTMAYILVVNANILAETGGTCPIPDNPNQQPPTEETIKFFECMDIIRLDLITATAASSAVASFIMGVFANLPIGLSAGMGMNAYFVYTVVGPYFEPKSISYETALCAVFLEGCVFLILAATGLRIFIAKLIPSQLQFAITAGIGMFLAMIGLQANQGIGVVVSDGATGITLGGCGHHDMVCQEGTGLYCGCGDGTTMTGATTWMGIFGYIIIVILMIYNVKGSIIIGILFISILSWFRNTPFTYFPNTEEGNSRYNYFRKVVYFHPIQMTAGVLFDDVQFSNPDLWIALVTFLYVDLLDTTGTLYSMCDFANMLDKNGNFEKQRYAFSADAIGTSFGATLGISPITSTVESGAGIQEGARTGISAIVISLLFVLALFFSPILSSIPPWATGPALLIVGTLMIRSVTKIHWNDFRQAFPAFITIIIMPFTYSIAYGIIAGLGTHFVIVVIDLMLFAVKKIIINKRKKNGNDEGYKKNNHVTTDSKVDLIGNKDIKNITIEDNANFQSNNETDCST